MFRNDKISDLSEKEFLKVVKPHNKAIFNYLEKDLIPNYIAYYIVSGYKTNSLWNEALRIHINSACGMFCYEVRNFNKLVKRVKKILTTKYNLTVLKEEPFIVFK